jgi:hypothetical protein
MREGYECASCGVVSAKERSLCRPRLAASVCDYLTDPAAPPPILCAPSRSRVVESCAVCARPALGQGMVCVPWTFER